MTYDNFRSLMRTASLMIILTSVIGMSAKAGGETYSIYLNKKLLFTRHVHSNNPLEIKTLELGKANYDDQLVIYYYGCGPIAKGRSIVIKDNEGQILKKWAFGDSKEGGAMSIPVKEILALEKNNGGAKTSLYYYSSNTVPKGRMLAPVALGDAKKSVTIREENNTNEWPAWAVRILVFSIFGFVGLMS